MPNTRKRFTPPPAKPAARTGLLLALLLGVLFLLPANRANAFLGDSDHPVQPRIITQTQSIQPGQTITVAVRFDIQDKWHLYWTNPEGPGFAPGIAWTVPEGFTLSEGRWPAPKKFDSFGNLQFGYEHKLTVLYDLTAPKDASADTATLKADLTWLVCDEQNCVNSPGYPNALPVTLDLPISDQTPEPSADKGLIEQAQAKVPFVPQGWVITTEVVSDGITLVMRAPTEADAKALEGLYFFSSEQYAVDPGAEQTLTVEGKTARLSLVERKAAPFNVPIKREKPITQLAGVLTAKKGFGSDRPVAITVGPSAQRMAADRAVDSPGGGDAQAAGKKNDQSSDAGADADADSDTQTGDMGFRLALGFAFLGGMILNLMPCVFPVLSIKILGFVKLAGEQPHIVRRHGYAFGIGVMVSFWILIAIILILRQTLDLSWGFQLQNPAFVLGMILLCFLVGLNLIGAFEFGLGLSAKAGQASQTVKKDGYGKSFLTGVLATLIATPCAAPFMAPAIGAAFAMPDVQAFFVFSALGLGMAAPYVLLSCFPMLLNYLPKPGPWMESFKQAMAFPMFATAGWLCLTYIKLIDIEITDVLLMSLAIIALGVWVLGRWSTPIRSVRTRWIARAVALFFVLFGLGYVYTSSDKIVSERIAREQDRAAGRYVYEWIDYSPETIDSLRASGRPVLVDFTASWCAVCQDNKRQVLKTKASAAFYEKHNVALVEADFTGFDPAISKVLKAFKRSSVPLYLVYPPGDQAAEPMILPNRPSLSDIKEAVLGSADTDATPPATASR